MKQVRLYGPDDLRLDEMPQPLSGPDDVVVKVHSFGICGSDLHFKKVGTTGPRVNMPCGIGHEFVGVIHQAGENIRDLKPGMRVVVDPIEHGNGIGIGAPEGAYAEYVLIKNAGPTGPVFPLPEALSFERAVLTEPIAVATHAINQGDFPDGGSAVVFGTGPIGLAAIAVLKYRGASRIVAVDVVPERLERARALGATDVVPANDGEIRGAIMARAGQLTELNMPCANVDLFLDAAGAPGIVNDVAHIARPRGRSKIVLVAMSSKPVSIDATQLVARELCIRGSLCYPSEFPEVVRMLSDPEFRIEPMISHHFGFGDFDEAFKTAENPNLSAKVVVRMG